MRGQIKKETQKALFISFTNGRESWVPKSVIHSDIDTHSSSIQEFAIAKWFVDKNNLILDTSNPNIMGQSGSVTHVEERLLRKGIDGFETFQEIKEFKRNYKRILQKSTAEERAKLNAIIDALKISEQQIIDKLEETKARYEESLVEEKEQMLATEERSSKEEKRIKKIDKILEKKLDKPFKKDRKQAKKTRKEIATREKNLDKEVNASVQELRDTNHILTKNRSFMFGAEGELATIEELKKLPKEYYVINEAFLSFSRAIFWKKYREYVKTCKIDHVVVGPTGIFLIETKNWSAQQLFKTNFTPHKQIDRAGYIFFIHMMNRFRQKLPTFKVVATLRKLPTVNYKFVDQMMITDVVNYILQRQEVMSPKSIEIVVEWLRSPPHINNLKNPLFRRKYYGFRSRRLF